MGCVLAWHPPLPRSQPPSPVGPFRVTHSPGLLISLPPQFKLVLLEPREVNISGTASIPPAFTRRTSALALTHPWGLGGGGDILETTLRCHCRAGPQTQPGPGL